jgi:hypothetical protein
MNEIEAGASETESLTASAPSDLTRDGALRRPAVTVRRGRRILRRSVAFRVKRRLVERRFIRADRVTARKSRRARSGRTLLDQLSIAFAEPLKRIFEDIMRPLQETMRRIAEAIRPAWLGALQGMQKFFRKIVRGPLFDVLHRVRELTANATTHIQGFLRSFGEAITASSMGPLRVIQNAREWASGFMSYGAKLRRLVETMSSSWSWKLPDLALPFKLIDMTVVFKPLADALLAVRNIEWLPSTKALTQAAVWAGFWIAVKVRNAIVTDEDSEEVVRTFMLKVLDLFPQGEPHIEAAKEALLEDAWLRAEPAELKKILRKRITELHRNHRFIGTTELRHHHIVSLETPSDRSVSDGGRLLTIGEALADPLTVENVLFGSEFRDERIEPVLGKLKVQEARVVRLWVRDAAMTWERAAVEAGMPPGFGESVRKKLKSLGQESDRRRVNALRTSSLIQLKAKIAFC